MSLSQEVLTTAAGLLNRALSGNLPLDELYESWPEELDSVPFGSQMYEQVEDAVEHWPHVDEEVLGQLRVDLLVVRLAGRCQSIGDLHEVLSKADKSLVEEMIRLFSS